MASRVSLPHAVLLAERSSRLRGLAGPGPLRGFRSRSHRAGRGDPGQRRDRPPVLPAPVDDERTGRGPARHRLRNPTAVRVRSARERLRHHLHGRGSLTPEEHRGMLELRRSLLGAVDAETLVEALDLPLEQIAAPITFPACPKAGLGRRSRAGSRSPGRTPGPRPWACSRWHPGHSGAEPTVGELRAPGRADRDQREVPVARTRVPGGRDGAPGVQGPSSETALGRPWPRTRLTSRVRGHPRAVDSGRGALPGHPCGFATASGAAATGA